MFHRSLRSKRFRGVLRCLIGSSVFSFSPHFARVQKFENQLFSAENSTEKQASFIATHEKKKDPFTFEPWILKICRVLAESEAVTRAVNMEMMITPVIIHKMQNTRPSADFGDRSPYLHRTEMYTNEINSNGNQSVNILMTKSIKYIMPVSKL